MKTETEMNTNGEWSEIKKKNTRNDKRERKIIYWILTESFVTANLKCSESSFICRKLIKEWAKLNTSLLRKWKMHEISSSFYSHQYQAA